VAQKPEPLSKDIAALLLFGSIGIVESYISLTSYVIVFTRKRIGSLFLEKSGAQNNP